MIRGFYTSVSAIISSTTRQAVVADNIANVSTPGFREARTAQTAFEIELARSTGGQLGPLATAAMASGLTASRAPGAVETTGLATDLAIDGDGLFVVRGPAGIAYTRAGDFVLDASGTLTTQAGEQVLDTAGRPIVVPGGATSFAVGPDGTVAGTGQRIAVAPWPPGGLVRRGATLLAAPAGLPAAGPPFASATGAPGASSLRQGAREHSNVDLATAMTDLIGCQRSLSLDARALSIQDETLGEAIQIGRLR